jgi:two-component system response regulator PilR (NtrC family)
MALERCNGVKKRSAELLGLTFRSFRYRLAKFGMDDE